MRKGWEIKKIGDCFKLKSGAMMTAKMMNDNGVYPVYGGNGISGLHDEFNLSGSNVIVGRVGALCGNVRHINQEIWLTDNAFQVVDLKFDFDNAFLTYLLNFKNLRSFARQAAQPVISNSSLNQLILEFPNDKKEQQRIVSILDEAFSSIEQAKENLQRNLQNAKELFQSELNSIFTNKGEGWEEKPLGEIATFRNGMNFTKQSRGASIKIVGVKDFQKHFWINFDNLESVTLDGKLNDLDSLRENDILAVRSNGNPELIGRCILAGNVPEKTSHSGFTIRIRLNNTDDYFAQYLCHFLKSEKAKRQLIDGGTGISIKSLNQGTLSSLSIPFPSFIKQQKIVQQLDKLSIETKRLEEMYQQKLDSLEELKKSILQKAFSGELSN